MKGHHYNTLISIKNHLDNLLFLLQPYPLSFIDEQSGERCHKRYKHARLHLARKTSPEDNLTDMMRMSLAWSDPKMSHLEFQSQRQSVKKSDDFSRKLEFYFATNKQDTQTSLDHNSDTDESEDSTESEFEASDEDSDY